MDTIENIRRRFEALSPHLDEKSLRLFVASETLPLGHGGVTLVSTATGVARSTIYRGLAELGEEPEPSGRVRRPGGGRKPAVEIQDGLEEALDACGAGDPERPLRWVSKSLLPIAFRSGPRPHPGPVAEAAGLNAPGECESPGGHGPSGPG